MKLSPRGTSIMAGNIEGRKKRHNNFLGLDYVFRRRCWASRASAHSIVRPANPAAILAGRGT
jgi:hypothetical protein